MNVLEKSFVFFFGFWLLKIENDFTINGISGHQMLLSHTHTRIQGIRNEQNYQINMIDSKQAKFVPAIEQYYQKKNC